MLRNRGGGTVGRTVPLPHHHGNANAVDCFSRFLNFTLFLNSLHKTCKIIKSIKGWMSLVLLTNQ